MWYSAQHEDWDVSNGSAPLEVLDHITVSARCLSCITDLASSLCAPTVPLLPCAARIACHISAVGALRHEAAMLLCL